MSASLKATRNCVNDTRFCVADILRAAWPANTAKRAAEAADTSPRTAEGWLSRRTCPSLKTLGRMAANNEQLKAELLRRIEGRDDADMAQRVVKRGEVENILGVDRRRHLGGAGR